ncbi:retron Ec78 anti-phage system effector HNH endonuclease PtuB [Photobacterium leiognathi]|uniref:retron Ec78 anti-phage system effector HNH endonuclease PtuB n=1 Tax=Photobacterium leiognathi TaxID=553611 RepID=UPI002982708D|nr:retron Ec78 anti-phage system effector HNH endonuclease PtuB [Photobacterium leiognathi]
MKTIIKTDEPESLIEYKTIFPDDNWKDGFRKNAGKQPILDVYNKIIADQKGLCAYCEIDLKNGEGKALNDFRVEHFFPENPAEEDKRNDGINYALYWPNMIGCCTGGNTKSVIDSDTRYTNPDVSCDVNKKNLDWTSMILNPLVDIKPLDLIFKFDENDGMISVNDVTCPEELKDKANKSIELLQLNANKLKKFRKAVIDKLNEELLIADDDHELDDYLDELAETFLSQDVETDHLQPFFSTIRWYLGKNADAFLQKIDFQG